MFKKKLIQYIRNKNIKTMNHNTKFYFLNIKNIYKNEKTRRINQ